MTAGGTQLPRRSCLLSLLLLPKRWWGKKDLKGRWPSSSEATPEAFEEMISASVPRNGQNASLPFEEGNEN